MPLSFAFFPLQRLFTAYPVKRGCRRFRHVFAWRPVRLSSGEIVRWRWVAFIEELDHPHGPDGYDLSQPLAWHPRLIRRATRVVWSVDERDYDHHAVHGLFTRRSRAIAYVEALIALRRYDLETDGPTDEEEVRHQLARQTLSVHPIAIDANREDLPGAWEVTVEEGGGVCHVAAHVSVLPSSATEATEWVPLPEHRRDWHTLGRDASGKHLGLRYGAFTTGYGSTVSTATRRARLGPQRSAPPSSSP